VTRRSLRGLLLVGATSFGVAAVATTAGMLGLVLSLRTDIEEQTRDLVVEQRIADRIVSSVYAQLFAAYRNLQEPRREHRDAFRQQGRHVYEELRKYLSHDMPVEARLGVETIKELHQDLEIAGQRALDADAQHDPAERRLLMETLARRATRLEAAVDRFITVRQRDFDALHERQGVLLRRLLIAASLAGVLLLAGVLAFVRTVRRRLLRPLGEIATAAERVGSGDLDARIPPQPDHEFAMLASSFNDMAEGVQEAHREVSSQNRELADALERLHSTQQELVQHEKLSALGGMLAGLAHELNNPLAGVLGMSEVLGAELRSSADPAVRRMADELVAPMHREAMRARDLVRNLLQFSRRSTATPEALRVAELVDVVVGLRGYAFRQAGVSLEVSVPPDVAILADRQQIEHAILNVVNNALDALVEDRGRGLAISASRDGDEVALVFQDDGGGFRDPARAFDPFYTTKPVGAGTGLGLTLVHRFVQASGGTVTVRNVSPRGAVVRVMLPAAAETPAASAPLLASPATGADAALPAGTRVLVVDDEPTVREVQRRVLSRAGLQVMVAPDGAEAWRIVQSEELDLVITDIRMPGGVDGVELYRRILCWRPELAERVLFATGDVHDIPEEIATLPGDRLLQKPFDRAEYVDRVRRLLGIPAEA
jgi:C4-dicarboxylate-specific signal transduction histidine kinase/CheY-like chemotaxis protein